jgi:hypothetical protein
VKKRLEKTLLVVVAKEPVPGRVKTRLSPALTPQEAATLYQCMLGDRIREIARLDGTDLAIAFTPANAAEAFTPLVRPGFSLFPQRGKDLGERLHNVFVDAFGAGYGAVTIIDSDTPDLPRSVVRKSFGILLSQSSEVVFGPCNDGGYYLVGMRKPHPELFENIPWSTAKVLEATLQKTGEIGLKTELLSTWNDLDSFEDLLAFYQKYRGVKQMNNRPGEQTLTFLANLDQIRNR